MADIVVDGDIHRPVSMSISHHKLVLEILNLVDGPNQRKRLHAIERNVEAGLIEGLQAKLLYDGICVLLLTHEECMLTLDQIHFVKSDDVVRHNWRHNL